jgi:hypothetical protein
MGKQPARDMRLPMRPWYAYESGRVAQQLYSWAVANEYFCYRRRYRNMTLYRLATGEEPPVTMGLWMSQRIATSMYNFDSEFRYPHRNVIHAACDTLENRIGTVRPFVQTQPRSVDFETRENCRTVDRYVDKLLDENRYYDTQRVVFRDMFIWGMGIVKVSVLDGKVAIERCIPDEILVDETATVIAPPRFMVQRRYTSRWDAMEEFGDTDEGQTAIRNAPPAFLGMAGIRYDYDMISLMEGWALPGLDGSPGRHVLCTQNHAMVDEPWTRDGFPFAVARWSPASMGWRSTGGAFHMAPVQLEINTKWEQILDAQRAMAHPRWLVQRGSDVTAKTMGARPGALHFYTGAAPQPIVPVAANAEMYEDAMRWENFALASVGVTSEQVEGSKQPGVNSGKALRLMVDIEDARNKSRVQALESLVVDVAKLALEAASESRQKVVIGGQTINWSDIEKMEGSYDVKEFPISSLSGTPEDSQQTISEWYADGLIDRRAYFRLQQMPDTVSYARMSTASDDLVEWQLDQIVRAGKFVPPEPTIDNVPLAVATAKARYNLETRLGTMDDKTATALRDYIVVLGELAVAAAPPLPTVPAQVQGPGAPPAPPPQQVTPAMAPPVPVTP